MTLWSLARLFLWLGAVSLGGPLAHIALMQREIVAEDAVAGALKLSAANRLAAGILGA